MNEFRLCIRTKPDNEIVRLKRKTQAHAEDDLVRFKLRVPDGVGWVEGRTVTEWERL